MSYDGESFKAGLALGRLLWQPPGKVPFLNTGLGWTADPAYLVKDAGTYLGEQRGRYWYKARDGYAVCCYLITPYPRLESSIMLASTVGDYAEKYWSGISARPNIEFDEYGLHWYAEWTYGWYDVVVGSSPFPTVDARGNTFSSAADVVRYVLRAASVRAYHTVNGT